VTHGEALARTDRASQDSAGANSVDGMNADEQDRAEILDNYRAQLRAMVEGDTGTLAELLTEDFSLTHMRRITADATVYGARA
jgi:hypothetical protein